MDHEILYRSAHSMARIRLGVGESVNAQAGAMVSMSQGIAIDTGTKSGLMSGLKRALGGTSFFINTFRADEGGVVEFAPPLPGDIVHVALEGGTMFVASGSYLVSSGDVSIDTKWAGSKGLFAKEGLFLVKLQGVGSVFITSYGAIQEIRLGGGESWTVDNGYMVAFDESVSWNPKRVGGLKSTLFSGEGFVCSYCGPGRIFMQSRSQDALVSWLRPYFQSSSQGKTIG